MGRRALHAADHASGVVLEAGRVVLYRQLMNCAPADADIADDARFDRHAIASILQVAADGGSVTQGCGLSGPEVSALIREIFPTANVPRSVLGGDGSLDSEAEMVRDLLLAKRTRKDAFAERLATMIARRAMEPNHLWEDLGLRERSELSRLLIRHFAPLALRNDRNMRWKRFFYRMLCEDEGFVLCTTPVCTECNDFDLCFGEETVESRMAARRREFDRASVESPGGSGDAHP